MAFYIGKMRGSVPDAAMGMDVVALFPHRCRLPVFRQTAFTGRSGLFQDGTRNNASGSMIISNCRTSDNCWYLTCRVYCCELSIAALRFAHPRPHPLPPIYIFLMGFWNWSFLSDWAWPF